MLSSEQRCIYETNPLAEVICQLRFPDILSIQTELPVQFQESIRGAFPIYSCRREILAPRLSVNHAQVSAPQQTINNYQFTSADGVWRVNLTSRFISLATNRYTSWEEFASRLDQPLVSFIQLYQPALFSRVGLRYVNFISRRDLQLTDVPYSQLLQPCYLGPLMEDNIDESSVFRSSVDAEIGLTNGSRAKIHAGPGQVKQHGRTDHEVKFIFDHDIYMQGNIPVNTSVGALQTLHAQA